MPLVTVERSYTTFTELEITEEEITILQTTSKEMAEERGRIRRGIIDRAESMITDRMKFEGGACFNGAVELFDFN